MSKELEDEFGVQIMEIRDLGIAPLREMLVGNIRKKASEDEKRIKAFFDTLTTEQKEEFLHAYKWGLDGTLFLVMTFFDQGDSGFDVRMEATYKGETEVLADSAKGGNVVLTDLYWEWLDKWGENV